MKKKLILVGNKPPKRKNIGDVIDSFDYVLRINRMNYYELTGTKLNGLYLEANHPFKYYYKGGKNKQIIKKAQHILMNRNWFQKFVEWEEYLTKKQYQSVEIVNDDFAVKCTGCFNVTSPIRVLSHLLNTEWIKKYNIYITCLDIENRPQLIDNNPEFGWHNGVGVAEQKYLFDLINSAKIMRLKDE